MLWARRLCFVVGLLVALWEITRPWPSPVLVLAAAGLMVPLVASWYRVGRL